MAHNANYYMSTIAYKHQLQLQTQRIEEKNDFKSK